MPNPRAEFVASPVRSAVDGVSDDLLTAGLGVEGLRNATPPGFADPLQPTPAELRRRSIYMNYRGLVDISAGGGFGSLFGPSANQRIAGVEYLAGIRTSTGDGITTALLQIPATFNPKKPCLIAVASSGSRGIHGALPTAGEWGLRNGCAVVHTDKGTGTGVFDIDRGRGIRLDGTIGTADDPQLGFGPRRVSAAQRPHSVLFKHAHSGANVEAQWGDYLLQAIDAAFQLLNQEYPTLDHALSPTNTRVIASGISNGGATVLRALERDTSGWIDGAVVSEPNLTVTGLTEGLAIESNGRTYTHVGASLYDYVTEHMLLQPCATLGYTDATQPFFTATQAARPMLEQWCRDLREQGVLTANDIPGQAQEAHERLLAAGILPEALRLGHVNVQTSLWTALAVTYAAAYGRLTSDELPCRVSFAATDTRGVARALTDEEFARLFADSNGIAPTAGINLVMPGPDGQLRAANLGNARLAGCLRTLQTGPDPTSTRPSNISTLAERIAKGQEELRMNARLHGRPVIILHGRGDGLIAVNHTSRAYYALNQRNEPDAALHYYEIQDGQHFDAFLPLPGFAEHYVPLQPHLLVAMDLMAAHLKNNAPLPPSQVVRTRRRQQTNGKLAPLTREDLGALRANPGLDAIRFDGMALRVPH